MRDDMEIRQYESGDRCQLFEIFRAAFGKEYDPAVWNWKFEKNPFQPPGHPLIYVVVKGGEVVGSAALVSVPFQIEQERIPFAWGTDLMVHPRFQGRGIAKEVYQYLSEKHEIVMSIGANEGAYHVLVKKTSWFKMAGFKRMSCYLDLTPYLHNRLPVAGEAFGFLSRLFLGHSPLKFINRAKTGAIREVIEIGSEFDQFWKKLEPCFPISVCRTSQYLKWRYQSQPSHDYSLRALYQDGELSGFFILQFGRKPTKEGFSEAMVTELLADPKDNETITTLIQGVIDLSARKGCHVVRCYSAPIIETYFQREGFYDLPRRDIRFFGSISSDRTAIKKTKVPSLWMLSYGDAFHE